MARLIISSDFYSQKKLSESILSKHTTDGNNSIIKAFMAENGIDPAKFASKATEAKTHDDARSLLYEQSTKYTQLRDVAIQLPTNHLKDMVQVLKKHYKAAPTKLADWGITIVGGTKVSYPTAFIDMANLILKFNDVHTKLAAGTSPLDAFIAENQIDLEKDNDKVQQAITYNTEATKKAEESAKETQLFNNVWQPVVKQLTNIGNYLMGIYVNAPRKTSDWGFAIDESPTTAKEVNTKIKLGEQVVLNGVVIGSTIKNTGNADIHIYKGKKTTGNPIIVKPGDTFGVQKGFSIMTINNPDTLQPASLTAMRNK